MSNPLYVVLGIILALVVGFGVGWHSKGVSAQAKTAVVSAKAVTNITADVNKQVAKQSAELQKQQAASIQLATDQALTRAGAADIHLEITHAVFTPPADAGSCPDPVGSDDFVRLYNEASAGKAPDSAASAATR